MVRIHHGSPFFILYQLIMAALTQFMHVHSFACHDMVTTGPNNLSGPHIKMLQSSALMHLRSAREECSAILWDCPHWSSLSEEAEKVEELHTLFHPTCVSAVIASGITTELAGPSFDTTLKFGLMRRTEVLRSAGSMFTKNVWPGRVERMSVEELVQTDMAVQTLYVNASAMIDCVVLAFCDASTDCRDLPITQRSLNRREFRNKLNSDRVHNLYTENELWLKRQKEIRDRFVHRVPPYIPPMALSDKEAKRFSEIEYLKPVLLASKNVNEVEELEKKQDSRGSFCPLLVITERGIEMPLLTTALEDMLTALLLAIDLQEELVVNFLK